MPKSDFWEKKDMTSMARSLRLAVVQNVYDQGLLTTEQAQDCLKGNLELNNPLTYYDDSDCLRVRE